MPSGLIQLLLDHARTWMRSKSITVDGIASVIRYYPDIVLLA